jgi:hypothetical protein
MGRARSPNGENRNAYSILVGNPEERDHWEDQDVDGWTILKWMLYCSILLHFFNFSQITNYTVLCATVYCKSITSSLLK